MLRFKAANVSINKTFLTCDIIKACHNKGFNVKTWTLNNKAEVDLYSDMDVDTFILGFDDVPQ